MKNKELNKGRYDVRNKLNNLTGNIWLSSSTTIWLSDSKTEEFSLNEIKRLINLFSKEKTKVMLIGLDHLNLNGVRRKIVTSLINKDILDYIIVNDISIDIKNLKKYSGSLNKKLDDIFNITSNLKNGKYISFYVKERKINNVIPNITQYITEYFVSKGFRLKGKVNLIFKNEDHSYIIHFKKELCLDNKLNTDISFDKIKEIDDNIKNGYGVIKSHVKIDEIGKKHPAPYSPEDIKFLLNYFTKENDLVVDPFVGVGSTILAAMSENRRSIGIDLNKGYIKLAQIRTGLKKNDKYHKLIIGDSIKKLKDIEKINYCVTSPPYHNILRNEGKGVRHDKSQFRQGVNFYSNKEVDLGNQKSFNDYLLLHKKIMSQVYKKLKNKSYCSIIVSDFTVDRIEQNVTGFIIRDMEEIGFSYIGTMLLTQNNKAIFPFGYPYDYVINHVNQYIVNFYKK